MRASLKGKHISGQERIVKKEELEKVLLELYHRPKQDWDFFNIKVEKLTSPPEEIAKALPVKSFSFPDIKTSWSFVIQLLSTHHGIKESLIQYLLKRLTTGLNPKGGNLSGALIVDPQTGKVLNQNPEKGIRTILFDWENRERIREILLNRGYTERTLDALALATKNIHCGVEVELCISDDPNYVTGYVASEKLGYVRITPLKEHNSPFGGRIYFVSEKNLSQVVECLRKKAVLIKNLSDLK
jgi:6-carboxyhexanoate--CoA ligase